MGRADHTLVFSRNVVWFRMTAWGHAQLDAPVGVAHAFEKQRLVAGARRGNQKIVTAGRS